LSAEAYGLVISADRQLVVVIRRLPSFMAMFQPAAVLLRALPRTSVPVTASVLRSLPKKNVLPKAGFHSAPQSRPPRQPASAAFRNLFRRPVSSAARTSDTTVIRRPDQATAWRKIGLNALLFGGGIVAINAFFNRETREEGLTPFEVDLLSSVTCGVSMSDELD
jgi:hypothetical protein